MALQLILEVFILCLGIEYLIQKCVTRIPWIKRLIDINIRHFASYKHIDPDDKMIRTRLCRNRKRATRNICYRNRTIRNKRSVSSRRANPLRRIDPLSRRIITQNEEIPGLTPRERAAASMLAGQTPRVGAQSNRQLRINPDGSQERRIDKISTESYFCGCRSCLTIGPEKCKTIRCILCGPRFFRNH